MESVTSLVSFLKGGMNTNDSEVNCIKPSPNKSNTNFFWNIFLYMSRWFPSIWSLSDFRRLYSCQKAEFKLPNYLSAEAPRTRNNSETDTGVRNFTNTTYFMVILIHLTSKCERTKFESYLLLP